MSKRSSLSLETESSSKRQKTEALDAMDDFLPEPPEGLNDEPEASKSDEKGDSKKRLSKLTPSQKSQIGKIKNLLKQASKDVINATQNANIFDVILKDWSAVVYEDSKSLARILHEEEGWTAKGLMQWVGDSPVPIGIYPLDRQNSRALWMCIRYRNNLNFLINSAYFKVDLPEEWLNIPQSSKSFGATIAKDFTQRLAIDVAMNQHLFLGKKAYWFQPLCEKLGWDISDNLAKRWLVVLFVVCADPELVETSTEHIKGAWSSHRGAVTKAFTNAAKAAEKENKLKYPSTFKLFRKLFPWVLE